VAGSALVFLWTALVSAWSDEAAGGLPAWRGYSQAKINRSNHGHAACCVATSPDQALGRRETPVLTGNANLQGDRASAMAAAI
jgi:hypothetical protein